MPLRNDLLNPIPGDNPSGANLRYEPITDKIKEARREEADLPQGTVWKTTIKTAELPVVIKLAGDVLANRSKDLQIAVWLVDAHIRKEGFPVVTPAFRFLRELLEQFWDTLYPAIEEEGDLEVRGAPLTWLGKNLGEPGSSSSLGCVPFISGKLNWNKYKESRAVGFDDPEQAFEKRQAREAAIADGKMTPEEFDAAADAAPLGALRDTYKQLKDAEQALEALSEYCDIQFADLGSEAPSFIKTRDALEEILQTVRIILKRRPGGLDGLDEAPREEVEEEIVEEPVEPEPAPTRRRPSLDDELSVPIEEPGSREEPNFGQRDSEEMESSSSGSGKGLGSLTSREDVARQLVSICRFLRTNHPGDPAPYLILRGFAWGEVIKNAPLIDHNKLEAPPSDLRVSLKRMNKESEWENLLEATEEAMAQPYGSTWLDLQRYTEAALSGAGYPGIAGTVNRLVRVLLEAVPDLLELSLPDDTPAANAETKTWLQSSVLDRKYTLKAPEPAEGEGGGSSDETPSDSFSEETPPEEAPPEPEPEPEPAPEPEPPPAPEPEPEPYVVEEAPPILEAEEPPPSDTSDEFGQALAAVKDGRTAEGLAMITSILSTERSGRQRFRRRTQLAHLLMAAGKDKVAQPLLDQLYAEIEDRKLEDWETNEAIAYPLELLLHCLSRADEERRTQLYTRICKLDPVRAVNCSF